MSKLQFSIGMISWKGYDSLENSLNSYEKNGLLSLTNKKFICLPEYTNEGIKLAKYFKFKPILLKENIGVLGHLKKLVNNMPNGSILLLENDLELIENKETTYNQIKISIDLLYKYEAIQVRLRNRFNPGEPFVGIKKYKQFWSNNFLSNLKRIIRPVKAKKLIGNSMYVYENPEKYHPDLIEKLHDGFFLVSSEIINWTNQSILVDRDKYLDIIIKKADESNIQRGPGGFKNVEMELNISWWRKKQFNVIVAPGLLTHKRLSYRGY